MARTSNSEQVNELIDRQTGLIDDGVQRAARDVSARVVGDDGSASRLLWMLEDPMATFRADLHKAGSLKCAG